MPYDHAARKPHGYAFQYDMHDKLEEGDTVQCGHCGGHRFASKWRAAGNPWCRNCMTPLCGDTPECMTTCLHFEKELELIERNAARAIRG